MLRASDVPASQRRAGVLALLAIALLLVLPVEGSGANQDAHFALVRSLVDYGTAKVDRTASTRLDVAVYHGHLYAVKAPGFAFANVPGYAALRWIGMSPTTHSYGMLWALGLLTVVLPTVVLLFLVRHIGEQLSPGYGTAAAATLGLGTIVFPFATVFFSHALSTLLGFAAFVLLWRERRGVSRLSLVAAAGLAAGLAVSTEFPNALLAVALGLYAVSHAGWARRGMVYAAGVAIGVLPVALYDWLVFGSPASLPYAHNGENKAGIFGLVGPSVRSWALIFVSPVGLLTSTPVIAAGVAGTILLYRRGDRIEALLIGIISVAFVLYATAYWLPLGGAVPGPRFLMPIFPFLAAATTLSFERIQLTSAILAGVSIAAMIAFTITHPIAASSGGVLHRLRSGDFTHTILTPLGMGSAYVTAAAFLSLTVAAIALTVAATPHQLPSRRAWLAAASAAFGWLATALAAHEFVRSAYTPVPSRSGSLAALVVAAALSVVVIWLHVGRRIRIGLKLSSAEDEATGDAP